MKSYKIFLAIGLAAFTLFGCSSAKKVSGFQLSGKWALKSINGAKAETRFSRIPYLQFDMANQQVNGFAGCNMFNGKFVYKNGTFRAPSLASTLMACPNDKAETEFHQYMAEKSHVSIVNEELIFTQRGKQVLVFSKAKPLTVADLEGTWSLESIEGRGMSIDYQGTVPTLVFSQGNARLSGNAGCNSYNAAFSLINNTLDINQAISTRMMCPDMELENSYLKALNGTFDVELDNGMLFLKRDQRTILTFSTQTYRKQ